MMQNYLFSALSAGAFSAAIFLLVTVSGLGAFFLFLSTLPIFWIGLGGKPGIALRAAIFAALLIGILDLSAGLVFLLLLMLPAWYISQKSLVSQENADGHQWFPLGIIFTRLAVAACAVIAVISAYYAMQGGIAGIVAEDMRAVLKDAPPEYKEAVEFLLADWAFLIFSLAVWLWVLALYVHAWITNRLLKYNEKNIRPEFAIGMFLPPNWLLTLLMLAAISSLFGSETLSFWGKSSLISLLLPYFLLGLAMMHQTTAHWPSRGFLLFFIYLLVFAQFWPAFILAGIGIFHHIKRLSSPGNSSRN